MGVVIKQSFYTSLFAYAGVVIGYFNVLWLFPYALMPEEIGLYRVIQDTGFVLLPFVQFGLGQAALRFYPHFKRLDNGKAEFLTFLLTGALVSFTVFSGILFLLKPFFSTFFQNNASQVIENFHVILLFTFIMLFVTILESYCRSLLKIAVPNFVREILMRFFTSLIILFYLLGFYGFQGLLYALLVINGIALVILLFYLASLKELKVSFEFKHFDREMTNQILTYCSFSILGMGALFIVLKIDSVMVSSLVGLAQNGVYTTAFYIAVVIELPKRAVGQISSPILAEAIQRDDLKEVSSLYKKASINLLTIGMLLFIGIWMNLDNIYQLVPNREIYEAGRNVVIIIGVGKLITLGASLNGEIIIMSRYYKFNIVAVIILAIFTIASNYLLIPIYGIEGAAIATLLSYLLFHFTRITYVQMKFGVQPFSWNSLKVLVVGALVFLITLLIPELPNVILDILIKSFIMAGLYGISIYFLKVSVEVNRIIERAFRMVGLDLTKYFN